MIKKLLKLKFLLIAMLLSISVVAQVTTAGLSGTFTDLDGRPASKVSFKLLNKSTGVSRTFTTNEQGRFVMSNLQVGGPYVITVNENSYEEFTSEEFALNLGNENRIAFDLKRKEDKINTIESVAIRASRKVNDNTSNGTSTSIGSNLLKALPTISRSTDDFLRLTPSSSETFNGISFAGRNGQYNNFSLDGAVFNNPFGLDSPTPGGQTGSTPISLDAIEQIQVNIAPYDVTQAGFTGAGINSVTKSGKNQTFGTAYYFFRNDALVGKKLDGQTINVPKLSSNIFGASLGGAIVKNKLFYFANIEVERREDGATSYVAQTAQNASDPNASRVLESDLIAIRNLLKTKYGYETGAYQGFNYKQDNIKWIAKLDWNINENHKFSLTYNGLDAVKGKPAHPSAIGRRGPDFTTLQFQNSGYQMNNKLHSFIGELNSNFGSKFTNKFRAVYTTFKDFRDPFSEPFPVLNLTKNGVRYIIGGHEPFSINNRLNQKTIQLTNNFGINLNNHHITLGLAYENFKFENSFNLTGYGLSIFDQFDINHFIATDGNPLIFGFLPFADQVKAARERAKFPEWTWYGLNVGQFSAYAQDEFKLDDKLKITLGIRADKPIYGDSYYRSPNTDLFSGKFLGNYTEGSPTVPNNDPLVLFNENGTKITNGVGKDLDNTKMPSNKVLFSPRFGFTYDFNGDNSLVLRGGTGLFTGRFPFVWLGNQIGNPFSSFYNVTSSNFQWPQVWRSNLGIDYKIKSTKTNISADYSYTKDVNGMMVRNYRLGTPTGTLNSGIGDRRPFYLAGDMGKDNAYVFTNTNLGYQTNFTFQVTQNFNQGLFAMFGYNYLESKDASSISAEISSDAFERNPTKGNANLAVLSNSLYGNTHRFVYAASKKFNAKSKYATTVSFFGSSNSGNRFSYVYGGDINNDGVGTNDLMYIPTASEINVMKFASYTDALGVTHSDIQQKAAFEKFIQQDAYLNGKRGQYAEKYDAVSPWLHQLDVRVLQDIVIKSGTRDFNFQLSMDIINFGNMINSAWGVRKYATTSGYFQPLSVSLDNAAVPTYQFDPTLKTAFSPSPELNSRWQIQFGIRFAF